VFPEVNDRIDPEEQRDDEPPEESGTIRSDGPLERAFRDSRNFVHPVSGFEI
jgi:hypothetical protein